mmetsp:Transcript_1705/g.2423  ORF Transcript_1705/g.2423 Transcript_1705/m.2423 type:complete len:239 (+) Transcript_1705:2-718(+)
MDDHGFCVAHVQTKMEETLDNLFQPGEVEIRKTYWPEIAKVAQDAIKMDGRSAKYSFCLGTQKFCEDKSKGAFKGYYSRTAHADFAPVVFDNAWKMLVKRGVPEDEAKRMDIMFVNAWKPFGRIVYDNPLTILDWQSVNPTKDCHGLQRGSPIKKMSIYNTTVTYSPSHRWVYLSDMRPDEVWLFKQVDSRGRRSGVSEHGFHTSFRMPNHDTNKNRTRRSIAVRVLLAFEPGVKSSL